jgi:O-antigen/teichoic acid export membrane protein
MLSIMTPEPILGYYGAAYRFFETLNFPYILTVAIYPVLSRLWKEERSAHTRTAQKSLEFVIIGGIAITIAVIVFADKIVAIFYGTQDFAPSVLLLQLLSAGLVILYVDMILGTTLLASDKHRQQMLLSLVAIPINIALNYLFIPYTQSHMNNGAIGAAVATGITEIFIMIGIIRILPREVFQGFRYGVVFKSLASGLFMWGSIFLLGLVGLHWVAQFILGTVVYCVSLLLMKTLEPSENEFLLRLLHVRKMSDMKHLFAGNKTDPKDQETSDQNR